MWFFWYGRHPASPSLTPIAHAALSCPAGPLLGPCELRAVRDRLVSLTHALPVQWHVVSGVGVMRCACLIDPLPYSEVEGVGLKPTPPHLFSSHMDRPSGVAESPAEGWVEPLSPLRAISARNGMARSNAA